ncbi:hypothetical protein [Palleronia marisminoris]|uniref:hypothetical protein n=1 Tax=Palleronia marisminoris TaxID=315423 RepID=UPI0011132F7D|nr:hypothetical protein [Palleronia marisminoris]
MEADLPTLDIGLGAQRIAAALRARVYPGPTKEISLLPPKLASSGEFDPLGPSRDVHVLHWHVDTFELPRGYSLLASTPVFRHRAFSCGPNVLGLQFIPKFTASISNTGSGHANKLATASLSAARLRSYAERYGGTLEKAGAVMLAQWVSCPTR